jgi:hypothetical protein
MMSKPMNERERDPNLIVPVEIGWTVGHVYSVYSRCYGECIRFSAQELLDIAEYVTENRAQLEQEAQKETNG